MKKSIILFLVFFSILSCKDDLVKKPDNLIDQTTMTNVLYDMALLDAIKYQYPYAVDSNEVNKPRYILKKYKIDSLQFVESNQYYASKYKLYKEMFTEVKTRIEKEKAVIDTLMKKKQKPSTNKSESKKTNIDSIKQSIRVNREQPLEQ